MTAGTTPPVLPPYLDGLIEAFRRGHVGRSVHLGWWDDGDDPGDFDAAQQRLDDRLLGMAGIADGQRIVDVGCGFGGTIEKIDRRWHRIDLTGVNLDARQLALCAGLRPRPGNAMRWLLADACALPLADASADRVLSIEAMFHFPSRRRFLDEAARVLVPGGVLVVSDIVIGPAADGREPHPEALAAIVAGFGPWPSFGGDDADHRALAAATGFVVDAEVDATAATLPSHRHTAPGGDSARDVIGRAAAAMAALHRGGMLRYPLLRLVRR